MAAPGVIRPALRAHTLADGPVRVTLLSHGCTVQSWMVGDVPVVLGYADADAYRDAPTFMGAVVGRVANRIAQGRFVLDGAAWALPCNDGAHHLHGGPGGYWARDWEIVAATPQAVQLRLHDAHLDQGYPGAVDVTVTLRLRDHCLSWEMCATPDRPTPVNMAQHVYFNLAGAGDIRDHALQLAAAQVTPVDAALIPDGPPCPVAGTRDDFRTPRRLRDADPDGAGHDINFVLDRAADTAPQAVLRAPSGMALSLWTDQPGLQLYTGAGLRAHAPPAPGPAHGPFAGLCLEAQGFPDAVNRPDFPSVIATPARPRRQRTAIAIRPPA